MTKKELYQRRKKRDLREFEKSGVDIGLLLTTLSKTPTERVEDNNEMLRFIDEARKARLLKKGARSSFQKNSQSVTK